MKTISPAQLGAVVEADQRGLCELDPSILEKDLLITEVLGLEGDTIITQDLLLYEIQGEDQNGRINGRHKGTGVGRPRFWERARYFGLEKELAQALDEAEQA